MAKTKKLSQDQHLELSSWGLELEGFSDIALFRLYEFVKRGNTTYGVDESSRLETVRNALGRWHNKRVRSRHGGDKQGTVRSLMYHSASGVALRRQSAAVVAEVMDSTQGTVGPFGLMVVWDGAKQATENSPISVELS